MGSPIRVSTLPCLTAHHGKLIFGQPQKGTSVYAACFIRRREIVLEEGLLRNPQKLRFILIHEIFHFVWTRLSNKSRHAYADLLRAERESRARGELGESSGLRKSLLPGQESRNFDRAWREYVCESFCDTAAWFYSELRLPAEVTFAKRFRLRRKAWFEDTAAGGFPC